MKVTAVVPIKLNNERFPGKNLATLGGRPLCHHLLTTLTGVPSLDEVVVYCSDPAIQAHLPAGVRFFQRDPALDRFEIRREQIVRSFVRDIPSAIYLLVHVTNPFLQQNTIELVVSTVKQGGADSAITVQSHQHYGWYRGKPVNFRQATCPGR